MVVIGRELTKKFETITYLKVREIPTWLFGKPELRGEFSILIEGRTPSESPEPNSVGDVPINPQLLASLLNPYLGSKDISEIFVKAGIMTKKNAYQLAINSKTLPS
jgi:16S rRNA (cytidine1402-2'-O)-methyltransferase